MDISRKKKRITYKSVVPNPLFLQWLSELQQRAETHGNQSQYSIKQAIRSLRRYPIPLQSGDECLILKGFGKKLCAYLDNKLSKHLATTKQASDEHTYDIQLKDPPVAVPTPSTSGVSSMMSGSPRKQKAVRGKRGKKYKPDNRTGGCALLLALYEYVNSNPANMWISKDNLIEKAQPLCEESFTRPKPDSHYTAWSTMTRLVTKGLVKKERKKKVEFSLTDEGYLLAGELHNEYKDAPVTVNIDNFARFDNVSMSASSSQESISKCDIIEIDDDVEMHNDNIVTDTNDVEIVNAECVNHNYKHNDAITMNYDIEELEGDEENVIELPANSFKIFLLIDKHEVGGASRKDDPTMAQFKKYDNLNHEYRHITVGDFLWIARHNITGQELVLPFIVERKRMDDLGSSIKDGRFHEQKFRLRKCGLPNVLYLIENYGKNKHVGLPLLSLTQAIANTRVQDNFKVHTTDSTPDSVKFLAIMTKRITLEYEKKHLKGRNKDPTEGYLMTFDYFNKSCVKNKPLTVTETFLKMLLQLKGLSVEKALAITQVYDSPRSLMERYQDCDQKEGEMLLAKLKYDELSQNVGPTISKIMYKLFTSEILL